jgi:hypothetical protein
LQALHGLSASKWRIIAALGMPPTYVGRVGLKPKMLYDPLSGGQMAVKDLPYAQPPHLIL